ncbi:MAG: DUF485 domain-containing protein [Candidatus Omnitrophota bacterium]
MLHKPAESSGNDYAEGYKRRIGVYMFALYSFVYAGFVAINVVKPVLMEKIICGGLNLAVVYGFGLIVFALFLALIYNTMCAKAESRLNHPTKKKAGK